MLTDGMALIVLISAPFVGSFLGTLAIRLPDGRSVIAGRSCCPSCGATLGPMSLVPVLSWALQRGRCASCAGRISAFYPSIELAALGTAIWAASVHAGWLLLASCALGWALLALAAIDARRLLLPDALTLPLIPAGLVTIYAIGPDAIWAHALGAAAGWALFVGIDRLYLWLRGRSGLGRGDAKLLAGAGAWVGLAGLPSVVLLASVTALGWAAVAALRGGRLRAGKVVPFGPFIALGFWVVWLYGPLRLP